MKKQLKKLLVIVILLMVLPLTGGCEITMESLLYGVLHEDNTFLKSKGADIRGPLYSQYEIANAETDLVITENRFKSSLNHFKPTVNRLWYREGFDKFLNDSKQNPKEQLISFYLFMEYHKDTQLRNLQYPKSISKSLLTTEAVFAKKAIRTIDRKDLGQYNELRNELVTLYKNMYREELLNILYENASQVDLTTRIPNIVNRYNAEYKDIGLDKKVKKLLDLSVQLEGRGIGAEKDTLYEGSNSLDSDHIKTLANLLTIEMQLSGLNMKLEKYFYVKNGLVGVPTEIKELKKEIKDLKLPLYLRWVKPRMLRSLSYLDSVYQFYSGKKKISKSQVFIKLKTREDFYSLEKLSDSVEIIIDETDSWGEVERYQMKHRVSSKLRIDETDRVIGKYKGD